MTKYLLYVSHKYGFPIVRPLQEEILRKNDQVVWFVEILKNKTMLQPKERVLNSVEEVMDYNPDIVLVANNEVPHFFPGIKVQLFHGFSVNKRSKSRGHFRIRGLFDLYCTQGPSTTDEFKRLEKKHKHFKVVETGWSKVDVLFPIKRIRNERPIIFLASTFTESLSLAHKDQFFYEIKKIIETQEWDWIINLHPKMDQNVVDKFKRLEDFSNVTYIDFLETLSPLKKADLLITDTTSLITEFVIQHKPVVTFQNNLPQDYMLNILNVQELKEMCEYALTRPRDLMDKIEFFIKQEHPYFDGRSSERVINAAALFLENNEVDKLKRKPLNLIRKFKMRNNMNYYKNIF
ncbi:MAG: UDP-N-acetylglucosamine 2-epimerase [Wenyingzhuangia sp.]|uniref:UDP-N-acetylglucosamine 2-epimerase n=1 Tax=Wenyingzhuangia sp. TaxID=1964193 RepID=UPI003218EFE8